MVRYLVLNNSSFSKVFIIVSTQAFYKYECIQFQMMQNNILKIQAFQYECFSTISEDSYLKFCEHLNILATQAQVKINCCVSLSTAYIILYSKILQQLRDDVFSIKKVNVCCQTNGASSSVSQTKKPLVQPPPKLNPPAAVAVAKERIFTLTADDNDFQQDRQLSKRDVITCDYCELKFNSLIKMQQHVNLAHSEDFTSKFFPCQKCELVFLSIDELGEHSVCAHEVSEDNKFEDDQLCPYCCEVKPSWVQYVSHLETEHHVLVCKICHTFCSDTNSLEEHIKKSHMSGISKEEIQELVVPIPEPKPVNKVPFNKRPFDDLVGIKKRGRPKRTEVNTADFTVLKCHFCNALFNSEDSLRKHIVYKHDTGELQCRECNLKFKRASAYENHMRLFHKKVKELKSAYSKSSNDKDLNNSQQQPLLQKLLLKSVRKEESKKNLNLVRGQSKPSCEICGEMCNRSEDQEMHKDFHITRKPDRFLCLFCNGKCLKAFFLSKFFPVVLRSKFNKFVSYISRL
jgi:Zinc finger, C2H2 type